MLEVILVILFFYFILQVIVAHIHFRRDQEFRKEVGELMTKAQEEIKKVLIVRVEKFDNMYYLYNQHSNEFICQGTNLEEVRKAYLLRYPDKRALVDEGKELLFKENINV